MSEILGSFFTVVALIKVIVHLFVYAMETFLLIRVIMSWIPGSDDNAFGNFIYTVTEPLVGAVRNLLYRIRALRELPIDFSVLVSCFLLNFLLMLI
ncbi:MAG: YggT family protein [Clostridia bacterium]|nr:YggT family protein [Clostridia bacterium]